MRKSIVLFAVENDCPAGGGFEPAPSVLAPEVSPFSTLGLDEGKDDAIDRLIMFGQVFDRSTTKQGSLPHHGLARFP